MSSADLDSACAAAQSPAPPEGDPFSPQAVAPSPGASTAADSSFTAVNVDTTTPDTAHSLSLDGSHPSDRAFTWKITQKISERSVSLTQQDVDMGCGSPMAVGKFLCCLADGPTQTAFMRVYYQIPIIGTEDADVTTLAEQVQPPEVCGEHEAFKLLTRRGCSSVPRFYGYCERKQGESDLVPGGYIKFIVWEKVPGESLTREYFWSLDPTAREEIRVRFRAAYEDVLRCGVKPQMCGISKIIYCKKSGNIRISGFRRGWPILDKLEWSDTRYVEYGLARPHDDRDWASHPEKWEY
ncbi:hypothetical protein POX_c04761 [Penicillium oxalicum]|uniref:hypothetical protein n=1 Tax=Penicillium oxalicum TaxID=69781 RepID=UPI0020B67E1B|nr:hypothetical protein POX_c04761 [Penicillium oxalicum]KAI2791881.1 hypothetical protein POX_c04761 [Penicillium oxalicum]